MKRLACVLAVAGGTSAGMVCGITAPNALAAPSAVAQGLQMNIISPAAIPGDAVINLDVKFQGGALRSVELTVDGTLMKKQPLTARNARGTLRFQLDGSLLTEGEHEVVINAVDANGNTASASAHITVKPLDANSPFRFMAPKSNAMIQGTVPIEIKLNGTIKKPYVMFFVDNDFLALINYAPYTYNWDTLHVANGAHKLSVEVYDGETLAKIKGNDLNVTINNPGGNTNRLDNIPKVNTDANTYPGVAKPALPDAAASELASPSTELSQPSAHSGLSHLPLSPSLAPNLRPGVPPRDHISVHVLPSGGNVPSGVKHGSPAPGLSPLDLHPFMPQADTSEPGLPSTGLTFPLRQPTLSHSPLSPSISLNTNRGLPPSERATFHRIPTPGSAAVTPKTTPKGIASPQPDIHSAAPRITHPTTPIALPNIVALLATPSETSLRDLHRDGAVLHLSIRPFRVGNFAARPGLSMAPRRRLTAVPTMSATMHPAILKPANPLALLKAKRGAFGISFDNSPLHFDVQPSVENGLPFAPFRQIFEHTGGTINWYGAEQKVHAVNSERDIEFRIGDTKALVNNLPISLEAKPFVSHNRAIVPLSFIQDALNVNVHYDPQTGHLLIESKK